LPEGAYANQGVAEPHNDADAAFDHFSNSTKHRPSSNDPLEGLPVEQDRTRHSVQARRGRLVLVIDAGCRVPELGGQLKPQTHVWTPEMTPKDDNTVAHITDRIDEACRELTKIADMLAGYPELDDTVPLERGAGDPRGATRQVRSRPPKIARSLRLDWPAENRARPPAPQGHSPVGCHPGGP
jgi:hypothetical protein